MKINKSTLLTIGITLVIGMAAGAIFFSGPSENSMETFADHDHSNESGLWTCSMHPQVRQEEPGNCPFCGMELIPANSNEETGPSVLKMSNAAIQLANIQTSTVEVSNMENNLVLNGRLAYDEREVHSQTTHFAGRIEKLYKNYEGQSIQKGEPIAEIYSPELVAAQEELLEAKRVAKSNPSLLEAARKKLKYYKLSNEQIAKIEASNEPLQRIALLANFNGIVLNKMVNNGDHIKEGAMLFTIANPDKLWAVFDVYEKDINQIQNGDQISFSANNSSQMYAGNVSYISPEVDPQTRVIEVRANVNSKGLLKTDMFIKGNLKTNSNQLLSIPKSAVLWTGKRSIVYIKQNGKPAFKLREVELGQRVGDSYEILSGLSAGEEVVTNGAFTIDAEAQLQGKNSMMRTVSSQTAEQTFVELALPESNDYSANTSPQFQEQLLEFTISYLSLKDAMVEGNVNPIRQEAIKSQSALDKTEMSLLKGAAHMHWMELLEVMKNSLSTIEKSQDRDHQRLEFINLSNALINALQSFGTNYESPLYIQFCPMANNDNGANWISTEENIINPYFGDMMLTCGSIEQIINQ